MPQPRPGTNLRSQVHTAARRSADYLFGTAQRERLWPRTAAPNGGCARFAPGRDQLHSVRSSVWRPGDLFVVEPDRFRLADLGERVRSGRLKPIIGAVRPLAEAPSAFAPDRRMPGKTIIRVTEGE